MSLTLGSAPLARTPAGTFNVEIDRSTAILLGYPVPHRVRALLGKETVVDSQDAVLLHETGHLPVYYFPQDDLRADLLEPSERSTHCPYKGQACYWHVAAGGRRAADAVWAYPEP